MLVRSCLVNAAIRRGGTARAPRVGTRMEDRERSKRTVVVWMLTLLSLGVDMLGSGRWSDLELSSMSGFRERS